MAMVGMVAVSKKFGKRGMMVMATTMGVMGIIGRMWRTVNMCMVVSF